MTLFPFLAWIAAATSATLLVMLSVDGQVGRPAAAALVAWFAAAASCQFLGNSDAAVALGLLLQTVLAICLLIRWKLAAW